MGVFRQDPPSRRGRRSSARSRRWSPTSTRARARDGGPSSDEALQAKTTEFRQVGWPNGEDARRPPHRGVRRGARGGRAACIGQRHYDVQLMGGAALHFGWIAEMKTGEGKTLVVDPAGLPQRASPARACTSSRSTTTWPSATPSGWAASTAASASTVGADRPRPATPRRTSARRTRPTSPTAPTTSSASTTCATTWP